eukprot:SAG22_NODE_1614_length_3993_cov_3.572419_5_plen_88_part_00
MGGVPYTVRQVSEEGKPEEKKWVVMGVKVVKSKKETGKPTRLTDETIVMNGVVFDPDTGTIGMSEPEGKKPAEFGSKHKFRVKEMKK